MDTIPSELLLKIFSYLRTDISATTTAAGRTLSLVSRRFRSIAFLVLYETISLKSIGRMRLFLEMLERSVHSTGTPVVRNLFLYDGGYDEGPDYESGGTPIDVCTAIITLAAPTLITLAGDLRTIGFTYGDLPSRGTSFPHLRDLSLGCRNMSTSKIKNAETGFPHMPNLRRLHKFDVLRTEEDILDVNLFTTSPSLTHIRISNFDLLPTLPHILSTALTHQKSSQLHLPKKLKLLMVQGTLHGVYDCLGSPESEEQWRIIGELQSLATGNQSYSGVLCVPEWGDYEVRDCEVDWREVVEGEGDGDGEGCWRDPPRETFSLVEYNAMGCPMLCD